jgi:hypothetical protein
MSVVKNHYHNCKNSLHHSILILTDLTIIVTLQKMQVVLIKCSGKLNGHQDKTTSTKN